MIRSLAPLPVLVVLTVLATPCPAAPRVETVLPGGTAVVLLVENVSEFRTAWPGSPLGRVWHDPAIRDWRPGGSGEESDAMDRVHAATGLDLVEILDGFQGQAAFCIPSLRAVFSGQHPWAVVAVGENPEPWKRMMARIREARGDDTGAPDPVAGSMVLLPASGEFTETAFAWTDGVGMLGSPPSYVEELLEARTGGSAPLESQPAFRELVALSPGGDVSLYVDLRELSAAVRDAILGAAAEDSLAGAFLGIDPADVVDAMGLEAFRALRVAASLAEDETRGEAGLLVDDRPGLARLFAYLPGPCPRPEMIPEDAVFASVSRFSIRIFWENLLQILEVFSPEIASLVRFELQSMLLASGMDFERDFLGHLGDVTWAFGFAGTGTPTVDSAPGGFDQVTGIATDDPATLGAVFESILGALGPMAAAGIESRVVNGIQIHSARIDSAGTPGGRTMAYAFVDSSLLVATGSSDLLDRVLVDTGPGKPSLWAREDLASLFMSIPPEACSIAYWDPSAVSQQLLTLPEAGLEEEPGEAAPAARMAAIRNLAAAVERHLGPALATTVKTPNGYLSRLRIRHPGP